MTKPAGGLRDRRRPDVMELLVRARPVSLDRGLDPRRQAAEIARLTADREHGHRHRARRCWPGPG